MLKWTFVRSKAFQMSAWTSLLIICISLAGRAAEVRFNKSKIEVYTEINTSKSKPKVLEVELALTTRQKSYGLMNRKTLDPDKGMLFVFRNPEILSFWMKDTLIDLDIGYFDKDLKLIDVHTMRVLQPSDSDPKIYYSKSPAKYALEVKKNWFKDNGFKEGNTFFRYIKKPVSGN